MPINEAIFRAELITKGRVSNLSHSVTLRAVKYKGKIYFSRHRPDSDWIKNGIKNSEVVIKYQDSFYSGTAQLVNDKELNEKISELKYPGEKRAKEKRVALEITLHEQL